MIGYSTVGTNDIDRARAFYDALLGLMGARQIMVMPDERGFTLYGNGPGKPMFAVTGPYDGRPATAGNGSMVALAADSREQVDALHARALELGGADEGQPGLRGPAGDQTFYGAYFRDPDGNKLCAFKIG